MICDAIGLTNDSFEHIYVSGGSEVAEIYAGLNYTDPIFYATKTMTGNPPLTFESYPGGLTNYQIYGNMTQNGTPMPSNPIYPQECGDRTENLFDVDSESVSGYINDTGNIVVPSSQEYPGGITTYDFIQVSPGQSLIYKAYRYVGLTSKTIRISFFKEDKTFISRSFELNNGLNARSIIAPNDCKYVRLSIDNALKNVVLFEGITVPSSYVPYGYKIPITCGGVTQNIYLDEPLRKIGDYADEIDFQTGTVVRRIAKYVVTGAESNWSTYNVTYYRAFDNIKSWIGNVALCNRFLYRQSGMPNINTFSQGASANLVFNFDKGSGGLTAFKEWLSQLYADGMPMIVYYILATPTTSQITLPQIPIISGQNTLSFGTALQPSSVSVTGHIKPATS